MKLISLEKEFTKACSRHPHLKLLESQWRFDKELISKALQNVSSIFPHYSRHDASHSKQIIVNIERLLGERIKHLTATDMWLLLEAAYSHDIGMIITHKQIQDLDSTEFREFASELASQPEHTLCSFAKEWLDGSANLPTGSRSHSFISQYTQIIAEWYRKKHPENSARVVQNPFTEIGLNSPRNELLPNRLFSCLASICHAHGKSFEETLTLPFSEAGMATEDCHPRYVAFLLRMGDLLDIDDNRFCPVMMRMAGPTLPADSHSHYEKHRSIQHFRLDSERIEIKAVCPSPESYEQAHQWFQWLEEEHYKQSQHWHIIVPSKKLGRLPTLSSPEVSIEAPFITIEKGKRPRFKIDETALLQLLRSTGLYSSKAESIREILQNAVDSTIIRIWESHKNTIPDLNPASKALHDIYNKHRIKVDLTHDENNGAFWLSVIDEGTGISEEDLSHMLEVGSSKKNKTRAKIKNEMPIWYRPSGNFGIGLQSIYILSDNFTITTKSIKTNKAMEIVFSSKQEQSVIIKTLPQETINYGAKIKVRIDVSDFPESISLGSNSEFQKVLDNYDFTRPGANLRDYEKLKILMAVHEFNSGSPIKLISDGQNLKGHNSDSFFSRNENILLQNINFGHFHSDIRTLFRGQEFSGLNASFSFTSCTADYYGHLALDFLSYNREKILPQARSVAIKELKNSLIDFIETNFDNINHNQKPFAAAFHFLCSENKTTAYESDLKRLPIRLHGDSLITLGETLEKIKRKEVNLIENHSDHHNFSNTEPATPPQNAKTLLLHNNSIEPTLSLIKYFATRDGMFWQEQHGYDKSNPSSRAFAWSDKDIQPVSDDVFKEILQGRTNTFHIGNRIFFPAWGKFRKLSVKINVAWARVHRHEANNVEFLVLPCKFSLNNAEIGLDEQFLKWTYSQMNNANALSPETHKELYKELVDNLKTIKGN